MAVEKHFVKEGIKEEQIEEYLRDVFDRADYSHIDIQRTALGTRIIVYAGKPGLVIGKSGSRVKEITEEVKENFGLENPMLDVREVENPFLDAQVISEKIAKSLERGTFYKKVISWYLNKIMESGAVGVEIVASGKLGGQRGRLKKFRDGYIKHAGFYADELVDKGKAKANLKQGMVGIQVKILKQVPEDVRTKLEEKEVVEVEDK